MVPATQARRCCWKTWRFPWTSSPKLLTGLAALFVKHGYTDPGQGVQFGHASAGNAHFVLTADFTQQREIDRFMAFTEDSVVLVADELHGSLKAEHGTGRAMAPFVRREWGDKAYSVMKRIKKLIDPGELFNPGVLINEDPAVVSRNIKRTPPVSPRIDKCIECGFCEHVCPSRLVTLTPRGAYRPRANTPSSSRNVTMPPPRSFGVSTSTRESTPVQPTACVGPSARSG